MTVTLDTPRLHLRPLEPGDFEDLHALTTAPAMRRHLSGDASREESFKRLLGVAGGWAWFGYSTFAVIERESGLYVGNCGLFRMERDLEPPFAAEPFAADAPEAGWIVRGDRWGRGYAGEAMDAALGWFDRAFGPQHVNCMIVPGNIASERLANRLGFRPIGPASHKGESVMRYAREPDAARA